MLNKLVALCKSKSTDSQFLDVPGFEICIENVEIKGKISVARKIKSTGQYSVPWVVDDQFPGCMRCRAPFGLFCWRHHCRKCGYLVCSSCSRDKINIITLKENPVRACEKCYREYLARLNRRRDDEDTPEEEPEPLLTRVPSWVQGSAEKNLEPPSKKAAAKKMRRISETTPQERDDEESESDEPKRAQNIEVNGNEEQNQGELTSNHIPGEIQQTSATDDTIPHATSTGEDDGDAAANAVAVTVADEPTDGNNVNKCTVPEEEVPVASAASTAVDVNVSALAVPTTSTVSTNDDNVSADEASPRESNTAKNGAKKNRKKGKKNNK